MKIIKAVLIIAFIILNFQVWVNIISLKSEVDFYASIIQMQNEYIKVLEIKEKQYEIY